MQKYPSSIQEEELKNRVAADFFSAYNCTRIIGKIDFCAAIPATELGLFEATSALWAEAKSGTSKDIHESFVQLILTIGRGKINQSERPPFFLGAFDAEKIAFLPYESVIEVFTQNDFNWNVKPSDHTTKEFAQLYALVKSTIEEKSLLFNYTSDEDELRKFIKANFVTGSRDVSRIQITRNNFTHIYQKWRVEVMPSLAVENWDDLRKEGIIDADFFLADILSDKDNRTIRKKLFVLLQSDKYEVKYGKAKSGLDLVSNIGFSDGQKAHKRFWNRYNRPPRKDYWDFIVSRRDLLVDQDVRERKGAFFTPQKWVQLSQEYLAKALGDNWQDEYVIWDCCAGTGNLEAGLTNKYNIWASTIDKADVDVIHTRIKMMEEQRTGSSNLLDSHVFQFDFLNDSFDKLPKGLRDIVNDHEKRKKLVVYINPPYAEAATKSAIKGTGENKTSVATATKANIKYKPTIGAAANELFALFLIRSCKEFDGCKIGQFSKLKAVSAPNFSAFRTEFQCKLLNSFIVPANTFDNVTGKFPIGFFVWDGEQKETFVQTQTDVYTAKGEYDGTKTISAPPEKRLLMDWLRTFYDKNGNRLCYLRMLGSDVQNTGGVFITSNPSPNDLRERKTCDVTANNIGTLCVYFSVRHNVDGTWKNDRDQFLWPSDLWLADCDFKSNCLVYTIFSSFNNTQSAFGPNHWIPYTESEVGAQDKFASHFMHDFISGRIQPSQTTPSQSDLFNGSPVLTATAPSVAAPLSFSTSATAVLDAGRELWRYYHAQPHANPNASYYDIRRHFQGVKTTASGKEQMNSASDDTRYTELNDALKAAMKSLAREIEPKIYDYGFLKR